MFTSSEFHHWCHKLQFDASTCDLIARIRFSAPSRRVQGRAGNVSGTFPSRKMGVTIQFESHTVELGAIYLMEHDDEVLEFYDQPPSFKLSYQTLSGRKTAPFHTPDFFVIRQDQAGWEEWKTEEHRAIAYDDEFLMESSPTTRKGMAKGEPGRGIKIHGIYYSAPPLRQPDVEGSSVKARYDPFDIGTAYAYVRRRWIRCVSVSCSAFRPHRKGAPAGLQRNPAAAPASHCQRCSHCPAPG